MKVGFSRLEVTAPLGTVINGYHQPRISDGVKDPITVTAIAFSDGENTAVAVTMDILEMVRVDCDYLRGLIAERHGIDAEAVLLHCTHSHTTPEISGVMFERSEQYRDYFFKRVADAAGFAIADLKEAKISVATGEAKEVAFNRRFIYTDGKCNGYPKTPEDYANIVGTDGEPDETVQLVKIEREGAHDIAIVNFQTHPDTQGGNQFSADYVHFVRLTLEQALADEADGKGTKVAFFDGAQGDCGYVDLRDRSKRGYKHCRHIGRVIAAGILSVYTYAEPVEDGKVFFKQVDVHIPAINENAKDRDIKLSCLGFGNIAFIGLPGEPFAEVGRQIKAKCEFKMTIPTCNTNDWISYIPMPGCFKYGGYGVGGRGTFNPETGPMLIDKAVELSKEFMNK